jgi:ribonuclease J
MAGPELLFAPLGGIGEIGMNLSIYGFGEGPRRKWLMVDCGVAFGSEDHLPGIDLILPDIRFLLEERRNIVGLVLTHAHEDHMGALIDLWPRLKVPLYASPFAAALFEARRLSEAGAPEIPVKVVPLDGRIELAPFTIDFVNVAHSIPESNALAIRTALGTVVHTGDWKIDETPLVGPPTDRAKLTALGDEGVLALVGDSTNAVREGRSPSESEVAKTLAACRAHPRRRRGCACCRARSRGGGPRHGAGRAGGARDRLSRWRPGFPGNAGLRLSAARQGLGALHRQSRRATRRTRTHCPRRAPGNHA